MEFSRPMLETVATTPDFELAGKTPGLGKEEHFGWKPLITGLAGDPSSTIGALAQRCVPSRRQQAGSSERALASSSGVIGEEPIMASNSTASARRIQTSAFYLSDISFSTLSCGKLSQPTAQRAGGNFASFRCNERRWIPSSRAACEMFPPQSVITRCMCSHSTLASVGTASGTSGSVLGAERRRS